jgi:GTPase
MTQRCGLVAVMGAPNAGKSTLVNALVGQKVAIVSPKAQTTRAKLMGIAIEDEAQLLLVDTPGIFDPKRRLDRAMVAAAWGGTEGADLVVLVIDAKGKFGSSARALVDQVAALREPKMVVLNKVDIAAKEPMLALAQELQGMLDPVAIHFVSALTADGVPRLKADIAGRMPEGPWHFPEDQVSDASERMLAAEVTREQLYLQLHAELPYDSAVETEKYEERKDGSVAIHQQILVARETQRGIILGHRGSRLKEIGQKAREELARITGQTIHLFLHVKVNPRWEEDRSLYRDIGLDWVD